MSDLDRLLEAARGAEPDPLDERAEDAFVRAARGSRVDRLLESARAAEPAPLDEDAFERMAERASMVGRARHRRWTRRRVTAASVAAAALAAAAVTLFVWRPLEIAPPPALDEGAVAASSEPTEVELATGDRIVTASGARYHVEIERARSRRVRLTEGAALFDVRSIERGTFAVRTDDARVSVRGTVFSVRTDARSTTVRVYEGSVAVQPVEGGRAQILEAGETLHFGYGAAPVDPLAAEGRAAAAQRDALASLGDHSAPGDLADVEPPGAAPDVAVGPRRAAPQSGVAVADLPTDEEPVSTDDPSPSGGERGAVEEPAPSPTAARAMLLRGDADAALATSRAQLALGHDDPWRLIEADALRALGQRAEAADAYARAARALPSPRREQAGFLEARERAALGDPEAALRALRAAGVSAEGSVLRERGLAYEVRLLARVGRAEESAALASAYLGVFPDGPDAAWMSARVAEAE